MNFLNPHRTLVKSSLAKKSCRSFRQVGLEECRNIVLHSFSTDTIQYPLKVATRLLHHRLQINIGHTSNHNSYPNDVSEKSPRKKKKKTGNNRILIPANNRNKIAVKKNHKDTNGSIVSRAESLKKIRRVPLRHFYF